MAGNLLKRAIVRLLGHRWLGVPAALASRGLGARVLSWKIARECGFVPAVVEIDVPVSLAGGARFRMDSIRGRDQVARAISLYGWDAFEKPMPELFGALSREVNVIFDVGAYSGFYSLLSATCNKKAEIIAFEPFPLARESLTRNLALNGLAGRVRLIPAAVSDQVGQAQLHVPPNDRGWIETSSSLDSKFHRRLENVIPVEAVTLDSIRFTGTGCSPVDLMKLDTELLEHCVLDGSRRILAKDRPIVFLEVIPGNPYCAQLDAIREGAEYASAAIHRHGIDWRDHVEPIDTGNPYASNQILCPAEKTDRLEEVVRLSGYRVSRMEIASPKTVG
jgi:FkbM family methyltransferase